jgi:uncharacterized membrane protein
MPRYRRVATTSGITVQPLIVLLMARLAAAIDVATGLIIAVAVGEAIVRTALSYIERLHQVPGHDEPVRLRLGRWLALALEFALASDIVRTAIGPSWDEIGKHAAIMALRTVLNYFLEREFDQAVRMQPEVMRAAA